MQGMGIGIGMGWGGVGGGVGGAYKQIVKRHKEGSHFHCKLRDLRISSFPQTFFVGGHFSKCIFAEASFTRSP